MNRLVVAISGASGAIYGIRLLEILKQNEEVETHLVMSQSAKITVKLETDWKVEEIEALADYVYDIRDIGASISSGSFKTAGMVVIPCSVKTLSGLANSYNDNLILRAGDVTMKERRPLVVVFRETPFHLGHIKQMERLAQIGGIILPPIPAFYHRPKTLDDVINQTIGKVLDIFDINHNLFQRWGET